MSDTVGLCLWYQKRSTESNLGKTRISSMSVGKSCQSSKVKVGWRWRHTCFLYIVLMRASFSQSATFPVSVRWLSRVLQSQTSKFTFFPVHPSSRRKNENNWRNCRCYCMKYIDVSLFVSGFIKSSLSGDALAFVSDLFFQGRLLLIFCHWDLLRSTSVQVP